MSRAAATVLVFACFTTTCFAQAMLESASGAVVGTVGAVGGKGISDLLNGNLDSLDSVTKKAADYKPDPKPSTKAPAPSASTPILSQPSTPASRPSVSSKATAPHAVQHAVPPSQPPVVTSVVASVTPAAVVVRPARVPPPVVPTPEEFAKVEPGATSKDLITHLGAPSYKINLPQEQVYHYSANGVDLGSLRVVDGAVAEVRPSQP